MERESTIRYSGERGFGETMWLICPVCSNAMKVTRWEDGAVEEECLSCERLQRDMELGDFLDSN